MECVEIMKASAGSGKTFALAREYIRLLLSDPDPYAYRHILAVTFTNKATGEMKSRIIKELDTLAHNPDGSAYLKDLLERCGIPDKAGLSKAAGTALKHILNDYGAFSISTIDSFFQQTLRAFSREIGQFGEYRVELDRDSLVEETVDRVLDSLSDPASAPLLRWLSDSTVKAIEDGEKYKLESRLGEFASGFLSETYRKKAERQGFDTRVAFSEEKLRGLSTLCSRIISSFDTDFAAAVEDASAYLQSYACYDAGVSSYLKKKLAKLAAFRTENKIDFGGSSWLAALEDGSKAFTKKGLAGLGAGDFEAVRSRLSAVQAFAGERYRLRQTCVILRSQLSVFRVAEALKREFDALLAEKKVLGLEDTNAILEDIINGTDAPFIYERMGVRYRHFLLDEFQDTAAVQWENFRPLLLNSISEGCYNLVVGDVKQSIYRWRNTDWTILGNRVESELGSTFSNPLKCNWRSAPGIVRFNNGFFSELAPALDRKFGTDEIAKIYADVRQEAGRDESVQAYVELAFCDDKSIIDHAVGAVLDAVGRGYGYRDIAVVVRTNAMGGDVASRLIAEGIPVVTNDSLRICSGETVRTLVARLFKINDDRDIVNTYYAGDFDGRMPENCHSLVDLAEELLRGIPADQVNADTLYVLAFMDMLRDFCARNGNSLNAFLKYWKEDGLKKNISSPEGGNAVTVITIHKVKGLDYPCVVIPFPLRDNFISGKDMSWQTPDVKGTEMAPAGQALYRVRMSSALKDTCFAGSYQLETKMAAIDSINLWYVAMTRASEAMYIVAPNPVAAVRNWNGEGAWPDFGNVAAALYLYAVGHPDEIERTAEEEGSDVVRFVAGTPAAGTGSDRKKGEQRTFGLRFFPEGVSGKAHGTVRIKSDAVDFFREGGYGKSRRMRGTVLHHIMESVDAPGDLEASVEEAVSCGLLGAEEAPAALRVLSGALCAGMSRSWFGDPGVRVLEERDIIASDGNVYRPDRVVVKSDGVDVIDYKFAQEQPSYIRQVARYVELYRQMGYSNVRGFVWYVESGKVVEVRR